ncbi:MAG: TonB-dependent receptor [Novosphingobium sp.]|nr:TonB-dependent receptor [Novosphingobium sp.]
MTGKTTRRFCLLGASTLAICATPALAQSSTPQGAYEDSNVIIVSANKREQTLQETPIAITAVSAQEVELRGISETKDLSAVAPNVTVSGATTNATAAVVTIRGIPTPGDETQGFDSPIGLYLDGVYLARAAAASFEIGEIERIEVLRGPQGTLFGRNTTGGAINYITKRPTDDANLKLKFGYGNYNSQLARLSFNTGDRGGVRISAGYLYKARDGILDNLLEPDDSKDPGSYKTHSVRVALEADIADNLLLTNVFDWTQTKGGAPYNQLAAVGDGTFRPNVTIGGYTFAQVQPANVLGYLNEATVLESQCSQPVASISLKRLDKVCSESNGLALDQVYGNMTRLEWTGDSILIRSTTAFRWWKNRIYGTDLDGMGTLKGPLFSQATLFNGMPESLIGFVLPPAQAAFAPFIAATPVPEVVQGLFNAQNTRRQKQFSQELEIVGGTGSSFEWVLGGFYFKESGYELNPQNFGFVLDTNLAVFTDASFGPLGAAFRAANPARYRIIPQQSTLGYFARGESYAIYGQGTYRPGGADSPFGVTVGLRYSWDKKEFERFQNGATPYTSAVDLALNKRSAKFSQPTGHITLDYQPTNRINLYAKAARGYRSGGFNARQSTQQDNPATPDVNEEIALIPFNEEKIDAYEVGAKFDFGRARLNLAAFHNIYKDQQVTVPIPIVGGGSFGTQVVNAGKTTYTGFEAEAAVNLTDALLLEGSFGYLDIKVKQLPAADINGDLRNIASVVTPGLAPKYTGAASIAWSDTIGSGDTRLTARLGWTYTSKQALFPNPLTAPFQAETSSGARSLFNAQLRVSEIEIGNGNKLAVQLWGKNIFDKEYLSRSVDLGQLGFGTAIYGDPATFGIEAEIAF